MTPFKNVYDAFFRYITDDQYMEFSEEETTEDCEGLLLASIPLFEFPSHPLDYSSDKEGNKFFTADLTLEEINILAMGMVQIWVQRQVTSIEQTRQKYSGQDFKLTSQASHLQRLMILLTRTKEEHRRMQMLHTRRRVGGDGTYESTFDMMVKRMN